MAEFPWTNGDVLNATPLNDISGTITIEAGENVTAGNVGYIHLTDSKAYVSDNATQNDRRANGFFLTSGLTGEDVNFQRFGIFRTTGLTDKQDYYLGNAGAVSTTLSPVRIGYALSTTELVIDIDDERGTKVGQTMSFFPDATGVTPLTAYWQLMDGTTISDAESSMNGVEVRDMNGNNEILRSADTGDMTGTGGAATHGHGISTTTNTFDTTGEVTAVTSVTSPSDAASSFPPYVDAVMAIKIK